MEPIAAIDQISVNCFRSFMRIRNAELIDDGRIFGVMSHMPITFFNGIALTHINEGDVAPVIDLFRAKGVPFRWWLTPSTRPEGLAALLETHGMRHAYDAPGMVADLTGLEREVAPPAGITIRRVDDLTPWLEVLAPTFSFPEGHAEIWRDAYAQCGDEWTHFVAFLGDQPVATTSLLIVGELAGIYMVATLAKARGLGIGAAVTREAMRFARDRGATQAALQSSELGYRVYRGLGFVDYCNLRLYDWRPEY